MLSNNINLCHNKAILVRLSSVKTIFVYLAFFAYFRNMKEIIYKEESAKIVGAIFEVHKAQVRNYLTITNYELGILCNFNELYMEPVRVLNSNLM